MEYKGSPGPLLVVLGYLFRLENGWKMTGMLGGAHLVTFSWRYNIFSCFHVICFVTNWRICNPKNQIKSIVEGISTLPQSHCRFSHDIHMLLAQFIPTRLLIPAHDQRKAQYIVTPATTPTLLTATHSSPPSKNSSPTQ
jgi:hypothetical protein